MENFDWLMIGLPAAIGACVIFALFRKFVWPFFGFVGVIAKAVFHARNRTYLKMDAEALRALPEDELAIALADILDERHGVWETGGAALSTLHTEAKVAYTLIAFEREFMNGGIAQYFTNSSRMTAPYLIQALRAVHADKTADLLEGHMASHRIDVNDPPMFDYEHQQVLEEQMNRYRIETLDERVSQLLARDGFDRGMAEYLRSNLSVIAGEKD